MDNAIKQRSGGRGPPDQVKITTGDHSIHMDRGNLGVIVGDVGAMPTLEAWDLEPPNVAMMYDSYEGSDVFHSYQRMSGSTLETALVIGDPAQELVEYGVMIETLTTEPVDYRVPPPESTPTGTSSPWCSRTVTTIPRSWSYVS